MHKAKLLFFYGKTYFSKQVFLILADNQTQLTTEQPKMRLVCHKKKLSNTLVPPHTHSTQNPYIHGRATTIIKPIITCKGSPTRT